MEQIIINPNIDIQYSAMFIYGLKQVFGAENVCFAKKSEIDFFCKSKNNCFTFIVDKRDCGTQYIKVAIDYSDFNTIKYEESYEWADIYGKINTNWKITPIDQFPKIVSLASNFGVRCFGWFESLSLAFRNCINVKPLNLRKYFSNYYKQNKKLWLHQYPLSKPEPNYIFSVNTLWHSDEWNKLDESTNRLRADFMEICLSIPQIVFEGGFVPSLLGNPKYSHLQLKKPLSHFEYIKKLSKSVIAFNTPAVWSCHGWKLSEFLCMGKAIISTPLSNDLPAPLMHGESIHLVKDKDEIYEAIILLNNDIEYRNKLEKGARDYYLKYVSPEAIIKLLGI